MARCLAALALVTSGCAGATSSGEDAAAPPPAPPVVEGVPDPVPVAPADGLHRFIVRSPVPLATPTVDRSDDSSPTVEPTDTDTGVDAEPTATATERDDPTWRRDPVWVLDQSLVDQIDDDTVVVFQDGVPGFIDRSGQFVALVGNSSASSGTPTGRRADPGPETPTSDDFIAELLAVDGVVSAVAIGDGSFAVVTEEPDTLEGQRVEVAEDVPFALASDPYTVYQWTLDNTGDNLSTLSSPPAQTPDADIDGLEAMAGPRGEGVVVAVVDTGVDFSHPDLAGQRWTNDDENCTNLVDDDNNGYVDDCHGWDFGNEDNQGYGPGQQEHGTHVAGTIAATADNGVGVVGIAPEVRIMDLNVEVSGGGMTLSSIARAIRYAADNGADIINLSLGTQPGTPAAAVQGLIDAVAYAEARGVLVVAAAGNSSVLLDSAPVYPANIEAANMITVGASAPDETKASFSNYGSPVDLFAPGVLIVSTVPGGGYKFMNGTSMASPTVAGAAATVLSAQPDLDPAGIRQQLVGSADEPPAYAGLAANPVRINQAWALGIDPDPEMAQVAIGGLVSASPDAVVADITMSDPGDWFTEPYHWEASLVLVDGGQAYGITGHPVSLDWQPDTTDERGGVEIGAGGDGQVRLETALPAGTYGLVVEAVPDGAPDQRLGEAFVATFSVTEEAPATTTTTGSSPSTSTPATTSPGPTTTQPGPTTSAAPSPSTSSPATSPPPGPSPTSSTPTTVPAGPSPTTGAPPTTSPSPSTTSGGGSPTTATPTTAAPTTGSTSGPPTTASPPLPTTTPTTAPPTTSGGGSPTTAPPTTAPATTAPPTTGAPTTAPATTAPPTTAPPTTGPIAPPTTTVSGDFAVYSILPSQGFADEQTMVSIDGVFPSQVYVWFGEQPGSIVYHSSNWIIAVAPPAAQAGAVDVSLRSTVAGTVLLVQDGFTYVSAGGGPPVTSTPTTQPPSTTPDDGSSPSTAPPSTSTSTSPTTSPSTSPTTTPGSGPGSTTSTTGGPGTTATTTPGASTSSPGGPTSTTVAPSPSTTGPGSSSTQATAPTTTVPPGPTREARSAAGQPLSLGNGLTGVPLQGLNGLISVPPCTSDPCRTRSLN